MEKRWILASTQHADNNSISWDEICDLPCIVSLLARKGFASKDDVQAFLEPRLQSLSDPLLLPNLKAAVDRILQAH